jgi:hypothetical protein
VQDYESDGELGWCDSHAYSCNNQRKFNRARAGTVYTPLREFPLPFAGTTRSRDVRCRLGLSLLAEVLSPDDPWFTPDHISRFSYAQLALSLCTLLIWIFLARAFAIYHFWNRGERT